MPQLEKVLKPNEHSAQLKKKTEQTVLLANLGLNSSSPAHQLCPQGTHCPSVSHLKTGGMGGCNSICLQGRNKI